AVLEGEFPELASQDSPTQTVGGRAETSLFAPVQHAERMLSLDNVFSVEEFEAWAAKVERDAGEFRIGLDGFDQGMVALELHVVP
ncbi:hypothetical protein QN345_20275, partial [Cryobacterium sp. 10I1]|uniref:hypothetical protein n=1 Tax=Cryobacterium sp. 10I1 TaxID=3048578 RepID=UPI002B22A9CF